MTSANPLGPPEQSGRAGQLPGSPGSAGPSPFGTDEPELSDRELLHRHAAGDPHAFTELFRRHRDRLWAVALRTVSDPDEAADALQDAMISAFRNAGQFRGEAAVTTWLHRVVVNACLDRIRRRSVRQADPLPEDDRAGELATVERVDAAEAQEVRIDILTALRSLNDDQRAAIVLVDMEGYSVEEAAQLLDCAPGTVKSRCARGRARLVPLLTHLHPGPVPSNLNNPGSARNQNSRGGVPPSTELGHDSAAQARPEPRPHDQTGGEAR